MKTNLPDKKKISIFAGNAFVISSLGSSVYNYVFMYVCKNICMLLLNHGRDLADIFMRRKCRYAG